MPRTVAAALALVVLAALAVVGWLRVGEGAGRAPEPVAVEVSATPLPVGPERIYEGQLASSHGGFGYRLDVVGCGDGLCTAVVQATNEGEAPAAVETRYWLWVGGRRIAPTGYSGEGFLGEVAPGETVELRLRFPAPGPTDQVTQFEVADTVQSSGILFDL